VPDISKSTGRKYLLQSMINFTKPIGSKLLIIAAGQGLLASFLALQEMKTVALIDSKFTELEAKNQY
jgi:2-polyprenyl-3-methyl-5-hydroxy-6-metoxy-1,4-benzoquinol methylase